MNKFLNNNKKIIIIFLSIYVLVIAFTLIKVKKDVIVPSTVNTIEDIISIENESKLNGSINVVSVYSYENISLLSYLFSLLNPYSEISDNVEYYNINSKDSYKGGVIQKQISIYNAIIAGYNEAGFNIHYDFMGYYVDSATLYLDEDLSIGDLIISINDEILSNEVTPSSVIKKSNEKDIKLEIIKDYYGGNKNISEIIVSPVEQELNGKKVYSYGFSAEALNIPKIDDEPKFEILWDNVNSIGPSGGLLQSFYVYEKLSGAKLLNNLKIAGTGTIDVNGNVGLIGGIKQKIITAELSGIDVFFVPVTSNNYENDPYETNYIDALSGYNELRNPHIKLVPVWNLSCIIDYFECPGDN